MHENVGIELLRPECLIGDFSDILKMQSANEQQGLHIVKKYAKRHFRKWQRDRLCSEPRL